MNCHASSVGRSKPAANQVRDPNRHAARRIEWKVLEAKGRVERTHVIVKRMRQHAEAADLLGQAHRRRERIEHQRSRDALPLPPLVDRQLTQKDCGQRIRSIALLRLGQPGSLDAQIALLRPGSHEHDPPLHPVACRVPARGRTGIAQGVPAPREPSRGGSGVLQAHQGRQVASGGPRASMSRRSQADSEHARRRLRRSSSLWPCKVARW